MKLYFFPANLPYQGAKIPMTAAAIPVTWRRPVSIVIATIMAAALHVLLWFLYMHQPLHVQFAEAAPLPMIDIDLSAPPSPAMIQPETPPPPTPPKEAKKPDPKPVKKPKPKPVTKDSELKRVETQKEEPDTAPPAPYAPPVPVSDRAASPHNSTFIPASASADYLSNPKPVYPAVARSQRWEGLVYLRVYVTADGNCGDLTLQKSSGHEVLDQSALEAVRKWRFVPAKRGDMPEASWVVVPIKFQLEF